MKFSFIQFLNEGFDNLNKKDEDEKDKSNKGKSDSESDSGKGKSDSDEKDKVLGDEGKGEAKDKKDKTDPESDDDADEKSEGKTFGVAYFNPKTSRRGELTVKAKDQSGALAAAKAEIKEGINFKVREISEAKVRRSELDASMEDAHKAVGNATRAFMSIVKDLKAAGSLSDKFQSTGLDALSDLAGALSTAKSKIDKLLNSAG